MLGLRVGTKRKWKERARDWLVVAEEKTPFLSRTPRERREREERGRGEGEKRGREEGGERGERVWGEE